MNDYAEPLVLAQKALRLFGNEAALGRWHVAAHLLYQAKRHMEQLTEALTASIMRVYSDAELTPDPDAVVRPHLNEAMRKLAEAIDDLPVESTLEAKNGLRSDSTDKVRPIYAHIRQDR